MQIGVAVKHFEENRGVLPTGTVNETSPIRNVPIGNHIGWIPQILPYIEQTPLYEKINFNKGCYDIENCEAWFSKRFPTLGCPSNGYSSGISSHNDLSNYMACQGGEETPINTDNNGVFFLNSKLRSRDIFDGTSNTVFLGESVIFNEYDAIKPRGSIKYILPREEKTSANEEESINEEYFHDSHFTYGGLGWMSGTPGTIRNTGNPVNTLVGPFSNWKMPNNLHDKYNLMDQNDSDVPIKIVYVDETEEEYDKRIAEENAMEEIGDNETEETTDIDETETVEMTDEETTNEANENNENEEKKTVIITIKFPNKKTWEKVLPGQFLVGGYSSYHVNGANHLMGDGSIRFVTSETELSLYQAMGNRNDGKK